MEQGDQKKDGSTPKRHSRNVSSSKVSLPQRTALDLGEADPLANPPPPPSKEPPKQPPRPTPDSRVSTEPLKDFSHLLRPENFHSLSSHDIPPPFRPSSTDSAAPLDHLLHTGHFRAAAIKATLIITASPAPSTAELFDLLYIRLACLALINQTPLAAQESRCLQNLTSPFYVDSGTGTNLLPWELRVLATRLQGISFGDLRKAIMGYYDLARDARASATASQTNEEKELWQSRLFDLGIRVANELVEMDDITAAARHLSTLDVESAPAKERELLHGRLALLYLRIGNLTAARRCIVGADGLNSGPYAQALRPLLSIAEGNYNSAATQLGASRDAVGDSKDVDPLVTSNLAVTLLYSGSIKKTKALFEDMLDQGMGFPVLLFNLSTVYELCTDRSRALKMDLAQQMSERPGDDLGWERGMMDFKL